MSRHHEHIPSDEAVRGEAFCPEDWIGRKNLRTIIHAGRNVLRQTVRLQVNNLMPLITGHGGLSFFKTFADDSEYRILLTNHSKFAGESNTVVVVNQERQPSVDEPEFPDGLAIDLLDVSIPPISRWLNVGQETLYRTHHSDRWDTPQSATLLYPRDGRVQLFGNLANGDFPPLPARDLEEVASDADSLWRTHRALLLCDQNSFEPTVTRIE